MMIQNSNENNLRLHQYFEEYKETHSHPKNLLLHKIAIPLIVFHIVAMLNWIKLFQIFSFDVSLAHIAFIAVSLFYLPLNVWYAFCMIVFISLCLFVSNFTPVLFVWWIAFVAWTFQFIGHYVFEKKSPAFSKNFIQLLIGPLFVLSLLKIKYQKKIIDGL